jgi:hypothetical protein
VVDHRVDVGASLGEVAGDEIYTNEAASRGDGLDVIVVEVAVVVAKRPRTPVGCNDWSVGNGEHMFDTTAVQVTDVGQRAE